MIVMAFLAPKRDRRDAVAISLLLFASWVSFVLSWTDYAPSLAIERVGLSMADVDVWALVDALAASCIIALAWDRWWGWSLWGLLIAQLVGHSLYQFGSVAFAPYSAALDALFLAQVAVFILLGGGGLGDLVSRVRSAARRHSFSPQAPETRT